MNPEHRERAAPRPGQGLLIMSLLLLAGCKSDLNQQLLERELRYQEDQIYQLQDELQDKCARLESVAGENASLRRQLGVGEKDPAAAPRAAPVRPRTAPTAPVLVPPAIEVPDVVPPAAPGNRGGQPPGSLAPPVLDNVPPLPAERGAGAAEPLPALPVSSGADTPLDLPPPDAALLDPAARPVAAVGVGDVQQLSYSDAGAATHLVVNAARTACMDADGDGSSEGIKVVFEPRDAEERLVPAVGDVTVLAFDVAVGTTAGEGAPLARWQIPAAEAARNFRRTSRDRGIQVALPWAGTPPTGDHLRVVVQFAGPAGPPLEAAATIPAR